MAFTVCCSRLVPLRWLTVIQHPLYHNALPLESQVQLFIVIQSFPKLYEIQCVRYIYTYDIMCWETELTHHTTAYDWIYRSLKETECVFLPVRSTRARQYFVTCFVFFFFFFIYFFYITISCNSNYYFIDNLSKQRISIVECDFNCSRFYIGVDSVLQSNLSI